MEYIISKGGNLPKNKLEMERDEWFNIWEKRNFPYYELLQGYILYWFDTVEKKLAWKTKVIWTDRYPYTNKTELWEKFGNSMTREYYDRKPEKGYFLHYKIEVLEKLNTPKPNYSFSQLGWERMDEDNYKRWFNNLLDEDQTTLDANIKFSNAPLNEELFELNKKMQFISPERVEKLVLTTLRKDTKLIKAIKKAADYKCQYPNCGHQILIKKGGYYIEVAHIKPVSKNGQSILGNLIVLCPNHHKEFDYGDLKIDNQSLEELSGTLNGKVFKINLNFNNS